MSFAAFFISVQRQRSQRRPRMLAKGADTLSLRLARMPYLSVTDAVSGIVFPIARCTSVVGRSVARLDDGPRSIFETSLVTPLPALQAASEQLTLRAKGKHYGCYF